MKLPNIKYLLIIFLVFSFGLTACLKDKDFDNGSIQSVHGTRYKVVSIELTTSAVTNFLAIAIDSSGRDTTFNLIPVSLTGGDAAPQDIHVTLTQADTLVQNYNNNNNTNYAVPTAFSLPNGNVVTIPKGQYTGYLTVKVNPLNYFGPYALGFVITKVTESGYAISGNLQNGVVSIITKNYLDGTYNRKGFVLRATDPNLTGFTGPDQIRLGTVAVNGVKWVDNHLWGDGKTGLAASVGTPTWTINPDGSVTVTSDGGPFPGGLKNLPGYNSHYDPASKTFFVAATWGGGPGVREMYDTLTYAGPR